MTAKQKADELFVRFKNELSYTTEKNKIKNCALVAVTEIMYELKKNHAVWDNKYWHNVKAEIEKL